MHLALYGHGRWGKNIEKTLIDMQVRFTIVGRGDSPPEKVDGVIIATPVETHAELALPYLKNDIPVFIEKPLTASRIESETLLATGSGLVHVGHIHLHNEAFKAYPDLGEIKSIAFIALNPGPIRENSTVFWEWLPHPLSMAITLLKENPTAVNAWYIGGVGVASFTFKKALMVCHVSWESKEKMTKFAVVGEKGAWAYDGAKEQTPSPLKLELQAFVEAIRNQSRDRSQLALGVTITKIIAAAHQSHGKEIMLSM